LAEMCPPANIVRPRVDTGLVVLALEKVFESFE